jgi:allophanate hydrolase subunit 2
VSYGAFATQALADAPSIQLTGPGADVSVAPGGSLSVSYTDSAPTAGTTIELFLDANASGDTGTSIGTFTAVDGGGTITVDTSTLGLATGTYHLYATMDDGQHPPVFSNYAAGQITLTDPQALPAVQNVQAFWYGGDQELLTWAQVSGATSYTIRILDTSASGGPPQTIAVDGTASSVVLDDGDLDTPLVPGDTYQFQVQAVSTDASGNFHLGLPGGQAAGVVGPTPGGGPSATLSGEKFLDPDRDGVLQSGEQGLGGVSIQLVDAVTGAVLQTQTTGTSGQYSFGPLTPGRYVGQEVVNPALASDFPRQPGSFTVLLTGGTTTTVNFGNPSQGSISGTVLQDTTYTGVGDTPLAGVTVFLDANGNGALDAGEPSAVTDVNGNYTITNLLAGSYAVAVVPPLGMAMEVTPPAVTVAVDQDVININVVTVAQLTGGPAVQVLLNPSGSLFPSADYDFGNVVADGTSTGVLNLGLGNLGGQPLTVTAATITGPGAAAFSIVGLSAGATIQPAGVTGGASTVPFAVVFKPGVAGSYTATLTITSSDTADPVTIQLTGTGTSALPQISVQLPNNNAGGQSIAAGPTTLTNFGTIVNTGNQPLTVTNIVGGQFQVSGLPAGFGPSQPLVLAPGASQSFNLVFTTTTVGLERGRLQFFSNDPANPVLTVDVDATGLPVAGPTPSLAGNYVAVSFPDSPTTSVLRTVTDMAGNFQLFLPANQTYDITYFDPIGGLVSHDRGIASPSGQDTILDTPVFVPSVAPDSNGDGLPDDVKFATGLSMTRSDTSGSGIDDFTKLREGLPLYGNQSALTGVIASLQLQGEANAVSLQGLPNSTGGQTAYVATGSYGLAVVDATNFSKPVLVGQIALNGNSTDVSVDPNLQIAAVASNAGGLNIVDVSDPMNPKLLRDIANVNVSAVRVVGGVVYAAVGSGVQTYDPLTGTLGQKLDLGGGTITDLSQENGFLYSLDSNNTLRVIDISAPQLAARGSLNLPAGGGKLFVGGGIAYVGGGIRGAGGQGGFMTASVADPDNPVLLAGVQNISLAGTEVVPNGSGLAVAVGSNNFVFGSFKALDLDNVSDPTNTNAQITRFSLPQAPTGVAIGEGIAFVADGAGGLQVVNYLPFDTKGNAPTARISLPPEAVVGRAANGNPEVLEGSTVSLQAGITDDVQVSNVEVLVNGQVVQNDVAFPYNLTVTLPTIAQNGSNVVTLQVLATDTGGNVGASGALTVQLQPDKVQPKLLATNVPNGQTVGSQFHVLTLQFSKAMNEATFTPGNVYLLDPGGNTVAPSKFQFRFNDKYVQVVFPQLTTLGTYQLVLNAAGLTDRIGNAAGAGLVQTSFNVRQFSAVWINPSGGNFNDPTNWDTGAVPVATDDVYINVPTNAVITVSSGTVQVNSLLSENALTLSGGVLQVATTLEVDNTFTISGGTLRGATVLPGLGGQGVTVTGSASLDGVTLDANLSMTQPAYSTLTVVNGLTVGGTITLGGYANTLTLSGSQTLSGTGSVVVNGSYATISIPTGTTFTVGSHVTIRGQAANTTISGDTLVNQGALSVSGPGNSLAVNLSSFTDSGTASAAVGGSLSLSSVTGTLGTITLTGANSAVSVSGTNYTIATSYGVSSGQSLTFTGTFSTAAGVALTAANATLGLGTPGTADAWTAGTVTVTGGKLNLGGSASSLGSLSLTAADLNIVGTYTTAQLSSLLTGNTLSVGTGGVLDNTGNTLSLAGTAGSLTLGGGTLKGGTVAATGGARVVALGGTPGSALDGVTLNSDLDLTQGATVTVLDGLTANGNVLMNGPSASDINFSGSQTLAGTGAILLGADNNNTLEVHPGDTLTIGAGFTVRGQNGRIGGYNYYYYANYYYYSSPSGAVVNQGTIAADTVSGTINLNLTSFTNQGTLKVANGETLNVNGLTGNLGGVQLSGNASQLNVNGTGYAVDQPLSVGAGQTVALGGTWHNSNAVTVNGGTLNLSGTWTNDALPLNGVTVNVYSGFHDGQGGGAPYSNLAGTFTANDISFGASQNNFNWHPFGLGGFGADITASINVAAAGTYAFPLTSDDGSLLFIDGTQVVNNGGDHGANTVTGSVALSAGTHTLEVQFEENGSGGSGVDLGLPAGVVYVGQTYTNPGTITATNATIILGGTNNADRVTATGSAVTLGSSYTIGQVNSFFGSGNRITIGGAVDNTGNTLNLDAATGSLTLAGGTIKNGAVNASGGVKLIVASGPGATLDGVAVTGDIDLTSGGTLNVLDGLTENGNVLMNGPSGADLNFQGSQTLAGNAAVIFGQGTSTVGIQPGDTLTVAPTVTMHGANARIGGYVGTYWWGGTFYSSPSGVLVNQGAIAADTPGGNVAINTTSLLNQQGTLKATGGGSLSVSGLGGSVSYSGNGTTADATGSTHLTLVGGAGFAAGQTGQALSLNGVNQYALTPNLASLFPNNATSVTVGLWFNAAAAGVILDELGQPTPNTNWHDSQIEILADGTVDVRVWGLPAITVGKASFNAWHHVVLRYDEGAQKLDGFLDGVPSTASATGGRSTPYGYNGQLYYAFGAGDTTNLGSGAYFKGLIQNINIVNRTLSNAEVQTIYGGGSVYNGLGSVQLTGQGSSLALSGAYYVVDSSLSAQSGQSLTLGGSWNTAGGVTLTADGATLGLGTAGDDNTPWSAGSVTASDSTINLGGVTNALALTASSSTIHISGRYTAAQVAGLMPGNSVTVDQHGVVDNTGPDGLVGYWQGNGTAADAAGNLTGTLVGGASYTAGHPSSAQAFSFGGTGQAVSLGNPSNLQLQNFTIDAWVQRTSTAQTSSNGASADGIVFGYGSGGYAFGIHPDGELFLSQVDYSEALSGALTVTDTQWHNIAASVNQGSVTFYVDGVASGPFGYNPNYYFYTNAAIGARGDNDGNSFLGNIQQVAVSNRALAAVDVQALSALTGPPALPALTLTAATGSLALNGGTVQGGAVNASGGARLIALGASGSRLDGVTLNGDIDLTAGTTVTVVDGLTLNGNALLNGQSPSSLSFSGSQTLDGTGNVLFGTASSSMPISYNATLTVGAGITLHGANATIGGSSYYYNYPQGAVINNGAIAEDGGGTLKVLVTSFADQGSLHANGGGMLQVTGLTGNVNSVSISGANSALALSGTNFVLGASLSITNGESLSLTGTWTTASGVILTADHATLTLGDSNNAWTAGAITATNSTIHLSGNPTALNLNCTNCTIDIESTFTAAQLAGLFGNGNKVVIATGGVLDNSNNTLTLDSSTTGSLYLSGGTLRSGTVTATNGARVLVNGNYSTLDGVTLNAELDVANGVTLNVQNGLTLDANLTVGDNDGGGTLTFNGTQTLTGTGSVLFGSYGNIIVTYGSTLTIDSNITVTGNALTISSNYYYYYNTENIVNKGTIAIDGGSLNFYGNTFTNNGTLSVKDGGRIYLGSSTFTNGGSLQVTGGASLFASGLTGLTGNITLTGTNSSLSLSGSNYLVNTAFNLISGQSLSLQGTWSTVPGLTMTANNATLSLGDQGNNAAVWSSAGAVFATNSTVNLGGTTSNLPLSATNCTINVYGQYTAAQLNSLAGNTIVLTYRSVIDNTGNTLDLNSLSVQGGMIKAGTVVNTGGAFTLTYSQLTLDGVALNTDLTFIGSTLTILDGITLNKVTVSLTQNSALDLNGTQTLAGAGTIAFDASNNYLSNSYGSMLTIGAGIALKGGSNSGSSTFLTLINQGTIAVDGGSFTINSSSFSNQGLLQVTNGGQLSITGFTGDLGSVTLSGANSSLTIDGSNYVVDSSFNLTNGEALNLWGTWTTAPGVTLSASNATLGLGTPGDSSQAWTSGAVTASSGTVSLGGASNSLAALSLTGSTLNLVSTYATSQVAGFFGNGNTVAVGSGGTLDNTNSTLTLNAGTGSLAVSSGTLKGGTVNASGGAKAIVSGNNSILDGVMFNSDLDVTAPGTSATIRDGLTLNGTARIGGPQGAGLWFVGTQTLNGSGALQFLGSGQSTQNYLNISYGTTLTLAPGITVSGPFISNSYYYGSLVNQGKIIADGNTAISLFLNTFTNQGTIEATNGGQLSITGYTGNLGPVTLSRANSSLTLDGNNYVVDSSFNLTDGETLALHGAWATAPGVTLSASNATLGLGTPGGNQAWAGGAITASNSTVNLGGAANSLASLSLAGSSLNLLSSYTTGQVAGFFGNGNTVAVGSGGTLDNTNNTLTLNAGTGSLAVNGGTLKGGTVNASGGSKVIVSGNNSILDGVTLNADLDLTAPGTSATIRDGLILNGTARVGGPQGAGLWFAGTQTLGGTGALQFLSGGQSAQNYLNIYNGTTLTLATGITVSGPFTSNYSGSLVNQGKIIADGSTAITFYLAGFTNQGTIAATNGGSFTLNGLTGSLGSVVLSGANSLLSVSGTGYTVDSSLNVTGGETLLLLGSWTAAPGVTITAGGATFGLGNTNSFTPLSLANSTLIVDGNYTSSQILPLLAGGNTLSVGYNGVLDNTGNTLSLTAATGSLTIAGGTVKSGTISATGGAKVIATSAGGTLDGLTLNADLDATAAFANLTVLDGLTLNGTASVGTANGTADASLSFNGKQTLDGTGTIRFGSVALAANSNAQYTVYVNGGTLTIGPKITITGGSGYIYGGTVVNKGTIDANGTGSSIVLQANPFTNQGTVAATNGGNLSVGNFTGGLGTVVLTGASSQLTLDGNNYTVDSSFNVSNGQSLTLLDTWTTAPGVSISVNGATFGLGSTANFGALSLTNANLIVDANYKLTQIQPLLTNGTILAGVGNGATLDLAGNTLLLTGAAQSLTLSNYATILGGTITATNGARVVVPDGAQLDTMVLNSDLAVSSSAYVTVYNGLTLNGTATVGDPNGQSSATLEFDGTQTLTGTGTIRFGTMGLNPQGQQQANQLLIGYQGKLTLGPNITITGGNGAIANLYYWAPGSLINNGTITANTSGSTLSINVLSVLNQAAGTLAADHGGNLSVCGLQPNLGTIAVGAGSVVNIAGDLVQTSTGTVRVYIGGPATGQFGQIHVSQGATFAGTLNVNLTNSFAPSSGVGIPVITFGSGSGQFAAVNVSGLPQGIIMTPVYNPTNLTMLAGQAQVAADGVGGGAGSAALTSEELAAVVRAAIADWAAAGATPAQIGQLQAVQFVIADLPAADLGMQAGETVWIDQSAAGHGWYTDVGPVSEAGFTAGSGQRQAVAGRMDLLTVVAHELGHALGLPDTAAPGLMNEWLSPGTRRLPSADLLLPGAGLGAGEQGFQTLVTHEERASGSDAANSSFVDIRLTPSGAAHADTGFTPELGHTRGFASIDPVVLVHGRMTEALRTGVVRHTDSVGASGVVPALPQPSSLLATSSPAPVLTALAGSTPQGALDAPGSSGARATGDQGHQGTGDDILIGGQGSDLLIGGTGSDLIMTDSGQGLKIAGMAAYDHNDLALRSLLSEWASDDDYALRVSDSQGQT